MRWSNWEEDRGRQKKNHLAENSDERAGEMGLIWDEALAIARAQLRTGLSGDVLIAALCSSQD